MKNTRVKIVVCLLLVLAAVFSIVRLGATFSAPETYASISESIDKKTSDALLLTGTATVASAGLTLLPDDIATPVAEELADCTQYFTLALCVLYAEKYMLPLIGFAVFRILLPLFCVCACYWVATGKKNWVGETGLRLLVFALVLFIAVPASIRASDMVYATYAGTIADTISKTQQLTQDVSVFADSTGTTFLEMATDLVSNIIEAFVVMVATSCLIPLLVLAFFVWFSKIVLGQVRTTAVLNLPEKLSKKIMALKPADFAKTETAIESSGNKA